MKKSLFALILFLNFCSGLSAFSYYNYGGGFDVEFRKSISRMNGAFDIGGHVTSLCGYSIGFENNTSFCSELTAYKNSGFDIFIGMGYSIPVLSQENSKIQMSMGYSTGIVTTADSRNMGGNGFQFNSSFIRMVNDKWGVNIGLKNRFLFNIGSLALKYPESHVGDFYRETKANASLKYFVYQINPSFEVVCRIGKNKKKTAEEE